MAAPVLDIQPTSFNDNTAAPQLQFPLLHAIKSHSAEQVRTLLIRGVHRTSNDENMGQLLVTSAYFGDPDIIQFLVENLEPGSFPEELNNALRISAQYGYAAAVKLFLQYGANPKSTDSLGNTALHLVDQLDVFEHSQAITMIRADRYREYYETVVSPDVVGVARLLIEKGADATHRNQLGQTPLHTAAYSGQLPLLKLLIDYAASLDLRDDQGNTVLSALISSKARSIETVAYSALGAGLMLNQTNQEGYTPLHLAALACREKTVLLLLKRGALLVADTTTHRVLFALVDQNCAGVFELLITRLDPQTTKHSGLNLFQHAILLRRPSFVTALTKRPFDHTVKDPDGNNLLHLAADSAMMNLWPWLTEKKIPLSELNSVGQTALHRVVNQWFYCEPTPPANQVALTDSTGVPSTATLKSCASDKLNDRLAFLTALLARTDDSIDLNVQDHQGRTALHYAAINQQLELARLLIKAGARLDLRDKQTLLPVDYLSALAPLATNSIQQERGPAQWVNERILQLNTLLTPAASHKK